MNKVAPSAGRSGFTLVEIALAMLILSVGVLSVIGLFGAGLTANRRAADDTQMALFAEEVLNAVAAEASLLTNNWGKAKVSTIKVSAPAYTEWDPATVAKLVIEPGKFGVNSYISAKEKVEDYAVTYSLNVYDIAGTPNLLGLRLQVANGSVIGAATETKVYYREIFTRMK